MRVALLTYNAQAGDAIGNQVAEKLAFFLERGADVRVFVESDLRLHEGVRPHCRRVDPAALAPADWEFLSSADLVIVEYGHFYALLSLLPLLDAGRGRIVFDYHGVTPPEFWDAHQRELLTVGQRHRGLVWCADAAVTHSRFARDELLGSTHFPVDRTLVLGHALDTELIREAASESTLRNRLGLGAATVLLFVGRLAPNKRVPILVEVLARLQNLAPPVHLIVIGDMSDLYAGEAERCRQRARELSIGARLHILGHVDAGTLRDAYRSADIFVMPSRHEGFCIPVIEAMAASVPVVAARAGALPEMVGNAGLTFIPDDADDLARQIGRVLASERTSHVSGSTDDGNGTPFPLRVAVVSQRYGTDFVGGAETSLRTMTEALNAAGHKVDVFTTCTRRVNSEANAYLEGASRSAGIPVHRFPVCAADAQRYREAVQAATLDPTNPAAEEQLLRQSTHALHIVEALQRHIDSLDAIIVGPYCSELAHSVAQAFPDKTLLAPCFHDEPLAMLKAWPRTYSNVGGILYHTAEEQDLAECRLGINHPRAFCCGTVIDTTASANPDRGRTLVGSARPYVVYCGRYSQEKEVPALLEALRRYAAEKPERFLFVFMGEGNVPIPRETWVRDLGFVDEQTKHDVLAGAAALVQMSRNESLSLVALEAWRHGTPTLADRRCRVLAGHIRRCGGGGLCNGAGDLATLLDDLWAHPEPWRERGRRGQEYVARHYGSQEAFVARLVEAVRDLSRPLAECMCRRGRDRAARFGRPQWRRQFAAFVEQLLDAPARPRNTQLEIAPRAPTRCVSLGLDSVLVPIKITNIGTVPAVPFGPARMELQAHVLAPDFRSAPLSGRRTALPDLLQPGQTLAMALPVPVPQQVGSHRVVFEIHGSRTGDDEASRRRFLESVPATSEANAFSVVVEASEPNGPEPCCKPMLDQVQAALTEVEQLRSLPADYLDVTQGWFAATKRWLKRKLLGNFKRAYVDVLSRQQSAVNAQVLTALRELADCCATLDHAALASQSTQELVQSLREQLAHSRERCLALEARLERLESNLHQDKTKTGSA